MVLKNSCQIQLDIDSIDYAKLGRFVSSKLSVPVKWGVGAFFHYLNSRTPKGANREFVDKANWAKDHILKAVNKEAAGFGIKVKGIRFETNNSKVRVTLTVSGIENALSNLGISGISLSGVTLQDANPWKDATDLLVAVVNMLER